MFLSNTWSARDENPRRRRHYATRWKKSLLNPTINFSSNRFGKLENLLKVKRLNRIIDSVVPTAFLSCSSPERLRRNKSRRTMAKGLLLHAYRPSPKSVTEEGSEVVGFPFFFTNSRIHFSIFIESRVSNSRILFRIKIMNRVMHSHHRHRLKIWFR